ncbi:MAG TPA: hemolysin family protein [Treponemataceae bacterium]|nr:hemolysin family protein [Treponemataceae bacterium]
MDSRPPLDTIIHLLIIAFVLILLSMLFSASESAFLSVNKLRIRFLRNKRNKHAIRTGRLLDNKEKLLNTILIANNIVNISLTTILATIAFTLWGTRGIVIATLVSTLLLLVFGEIAPKTLGTKYAEKLSFSVALFIQILQKILAPLVCIFTSTSRFFASLFGIKLSKPQESFTEEDIKTFLEVGEEEGVLNHGEKDMMHRVFKFTDLQAKDIMVPRTEIVFVSLDSTYKEIIELSQKSRVSRFPVLGRNNNIDDIQGVLYMKDVLSYSRTQKSFSVKRGMRQPLFILETKKMSTIQQLLRNKNHTIAIVLDEYSGTAGLLTKEDITREIFGSIGDEFDIASNQPKFPTIKAQTGIIDGNTRLIDIQEALSISLHSSFYDTIAGYILEQLGRIPRIGDSISVQGWTFTVQEMLGHRVRQVYMQENSV